MMTNQKSLQLLTGNQIAKAGVGNLRSSIGSASGRGSAIHNYQPPTIYDEQLGSYTNYGEVNKAQLTASEALGINSTFQQVRILSNGEMEIWIIGSREKTKGVVTAV